MVATRWIVVGMDFSACAIRALEQALKLANEVGASVACVHAYEDTDGTSALDDPAPALCKQIEETIFACAASRGKMRVEAIVRRGAPWEKLTNVATELGAEFIVVGADGQRGAGSERFLGTVVSRLATTSSRIVMVVPSRSADRRPV
ncbi:MAG: universal stress protein [Polyangiaceae bacterium]|jgi:nucleotide-binding universal stress UspA family protein